MKIELMKEEKYQIESAILPAKKYLAVRFDHLAIEKVAPKLFADTYAKISQEKAAFGNGMPSALYYKWDVENQITDLAIAIPVSEKPEIINDGFEFIEIDEKEGFYIDYYGKYEDMEPVHEALSNYIMNQKIEGDFVAIEEYITDPATDPDANKWLTKISYLKL